MKTLSSFALSSTVLEGLVIQRCGRLYVDILSAVYYSVLLSPISIAENTSHFVLNNIAIGASVSMTELDL